MKKKLKYKKVSKYIYNVLYIYNQNIETNKINKVINIMKFTIYLTEYKKFMNNNV